MLVIVEPSQLRLDMAILAVGFFAWSSCCSASGHLVLRVAAPALRARHGEAGSRRQASANPAVEPSA